MLIRFFWVFPHGGTEDVWSGRFNPKNNIARVVNRRLEANDLPRRGSVAGDEELWLLRRVNQNIRFPRQFPKTLKRPANESLDASVAAAYQCIQLAE